MNINFLKNIATLRRQRGVVLMVVLTTIVFLVIIAQQTAFDTSVEFKNGVSHFHGLKAYYAAKSGLELTLLKILIYKKTLNFINAQSQNNTAIQSLISQAQSQLYLLWKPPSLWPPLLSEDISEVRKSEVQEMLQDSFFTDVSYEIRVENESSKFNINDLASPHLSIRTWAQQVFNNLLLNLRNQEPWLGDQYSEQELKEILNEIQRRLNPSSSYTQNQTPLNRRLMNINELLLIEGTRPELIELLRPYITVYSSTGVHLQFMKKLLIQSLSNSINQTQAENISQQLDIENNEQEIFISNLNQAQTLFEQEGLNFMKNEYSNINPNTPEIGELVFNFDAPQNFQIISRGSSGSVSKNILAVVHDPYYSIERVFELMNLHKEKSGYQPSGGPPSRQDIGQSRLNIYFSSTPFIIEWKDIN